MVDIYCGLVMIVNYLAAAVDIILMMICNCTITAYSWHQNDMEGTKRMTSAGHLNSD